MKNLNFARALTWIGFGVLSISLVSCGNANSHRQSQQDQNESNLQVAKRDLNPAIGLYTGQMTMKESAHVYDVTANLNLVYETVRSNQGDATQTLTLPKLSGFLHFPLVDNLDVSEYSNYSEIINPMGGFSQILFDFGDFDKRTNVILLPYNVSGYSQGNFGQIQGVLDQNIFSGTWFAKPLGDVGTFKLIQVQSAGALTDQSGAIR